MSLLRIKEVAAALGISAQTLKYWLVENPVDAAGVPFYIPMGKRWKFEQQDIGRILTHMRVLESARLGFSGHSKARLAGLLSKIDGVTYEDRLRAREAERAAKKPNRRRPKIPTSADLLAKLAIDAVLGRRAEPRVQPKRRLRFPKRPPSSD